MWSSCSVAQIYLASRSRSNSHLWWAVPWRRSFATTLPYLGTILQFCLAQWLNPQRLSLRYLGSLEKAASTSRLQFDNLRHDKQMYAFARTWNSHGHRHRPKQPQKKKRYNHQYARCWFLPSSLFKNPATDSSHECIQFLCWLLFFCALLTDGTI